MLWAKVLKVLELWRRSIITLDTCFFRIHSKVGSPKAQLVDISHDLGASAATTTFAWLPDTGADVDAISQRDAERIDSHLSQRLSDERLKICAVNGEPS